MGTYLRRVGVSDSRRYLKLYDKYLLRCIICITIYNDPRDLKYTRLYVKVTAIQVVNLAA